MHTLLILNPGHFHAALVLRERHPSLSDDIYVYSEPGPDLDQFQEIAESFNKRQIKPTRWKLNIYRGKDGIEKLIHDKKGDIDRISIPLESSVDDVVFTRMGDESMKQYDFLVRFVGDYELSGVVIKIAFKVDDTLTMTVPGQPVYTLVPDRDMTFKLKDLNGFRVEFKADSGGNVTGLVSHQPNGSFSASRKGASGE